jgi:hypothetical protein
MHFNALPINVSKLIQNQSLMRNKLLLILVILAEKLICTFDAILQWERKVNFSTCVKLNSVSLRILALFIVISVGYVPEKSIQSLPNSGPHCIILPSYM